MTTIPAITSHKNGGKKANLILKCTIALGTFHCKFNLTLNFQIWTKLGNRI